MLCTRGVVFLTLLRQVPNIIFCSSCVSIFAEANSLVILEEPVDDVFIEIKKADIRGGISAENVHIVSPYVGITQIRFRVKASAYSQPAYASTPLFITILLYTLILKLQVFDAIFTLNPNSRCN